MSLKPAGFSLAILPLLVASHTAHAETGRSMEEVVVTSTRIGTQLKDSPQVVTIISKEQIEQQRNLSSDTSQVLSNLLPAFSPSRQKLTSAGETFRGRTPLMMIDGVPQSNPLRSAGREGHTIDMSMIERIEVIHGASAIHGLGATGGIINFITRKPTPGEINQYVGVQATTPLEDGDSDTFGYRLDYRIDGTLDKLEYLVGVSYEKQGVYLDADGELVGVDTTQGDLMNSQGYDIFVKLGYQLDPKQHVGASVNRFVSEGDMDYVGVVGNRNLGVPSTSVEGRPAGNAPRNRVTTASANYQHDDVFGTVFTAQVYSQEFEGLFGADRSGTFQDPNIAPSGTLFDQSQAESDKLGAKLTLSKDQLFGVPLKLIGGFDVLQDKTLQKLALTNRTWVPESTYKNYAPFLQGEYAPIDMLVLHAGARYEHAELEVDTFRTLYSAGGGVIVEGGNPEFEEMLYNTGVVISPLDGLSLFANYSEGFGMPDVGRVLRAINQPNLSVDSFLNLEPILTDNREIGIRIKQAPVDFELSYYESKSDLGSRLELVNGTYFVRREKTEIKGYEASFGVQVHRDHRLELSYSRIKGKFDSDQNGSLDSKLDGLNIPPNRLIASWNAQFTDKLNLLLQASHSFDRSFDDPAKEFDGFTLVDASLGYSLPAGRLTVSVANLFNEDYFTYYSQSAVVDNSRYFKGRGRTLTLGYALEF